MNNITTHKTRYDALGYEKHAHNLWRIVNIDGDGTTHAVGPHYRTKAELLGDLTRYASEAWGYN